MGLGKACVRIIDRYQDSRIAHVAEGGCRFDPSCSVYMRQTFETRPFAVAWLLSTWRVLRCNPLARPGTVDRIGPKTRRSRPRPNALRTAFASMLLAGLVTMLVGGVAGAQSLSGPCTGTINGRAPASLTKSNPLVVREGQNVTVSGTLQGADAGTQSVTQIQVDIISGLLSAKETRPGTGPNWGGSVNVDSYLKRGSGLYRVHGTATAPGISCRGDGYVELDGAALIGVVAGSVGAVGLAGSLASPGISRSNMDPSEVRARSSSSYDADEDGPIDAVDNAIIGLPVRGPFGACCLLTAISIPLLMVGMAGDGSEGGGPSPGIELSRTRVWKRGHPVWGFISGLLFGIGGSVFLQQRAFWVLDIWTAIVLPVGIAVLVAIRARIGRPYDLVRVAR